MIDVDLIHALISDSSFEVRDYQVSIIAEVLSSLIANESTIINIPQGLGKTFISQVVAVLAHRSMIGEDCKILFLVPTRALAAQHVLMAQWMRKHGGLLVIDRSAVKESFVLRNHFKHATYVLSTPILLENRLASIDGADLAKVKMCVVDEIDIFAVTDWPTIRFHKSMGPIVQRLMAQGCVFIGLTASRLNPDEQGFWQDQISFHPVTADTKDMLKYLPFSIVEPVGVKPDERVYNIDDALQQALRASYKCLFELGIPSRVKGLQALVSKIASGRPVSWRRGRPQVRINGEIPALQSLALAIKAIQSAQITLFEDTIKPSYLDAVCRTLRRHLAELPRGAVSPLTRIAIADAAGLLEGLTGFAASISGELTPKKSAVIGKLRAHNQDKGLVFCRFVELAEYLGSLHAEEHLHGLIIHGQLGQREMLSRMAAFRWAPWPHVAFMTRDLGGRGLDFPNARYMVLYSPKSDFTSVDQEICRIRSNRQDTKPIYLLYYASTAEELKACVLLEEMKAAQTLGGYKTYQIHKTASADRSTVI